MKSHPMTYYKFPRVGWIIMAAMLVVFCGPIKRILEQRVYNSDVSGAQEPTCKTSTKRIRETKYTSQLIKCVSQPSPNNGFTLFTPADFNAFSFQKGYGWYFLSIDKSADFALSLPLYISHQRLQV
ncbi:MAG TPA: hypothetical protein VK783_15065 [Bacteroidia bacterium]|nr:hypothetical protein [Bacteroidia bacterium]